MEKTHVLRIILRSLAACLPPLKGNNTHSIEPGFHVAVSIFALCGEPCHEVAYGLLVADLVDTTSSVPSAMATDAECVWV